MSDDSDGNSEPEEGEITDSDREESTASTSSPSASLCRESPETELETEIQTGERKDELNFTTSSGYT